MSNNGSIENRGVQPNQISRRKALEWIGLGLGTATFPFLNVNQQNTPVDRLQQPHQQDPHAQQEGGHEETAHSAEHHISAADLKGSYAISALYGSILTAQAFGYVDMSPKTAAAMASAWAVKMGGLHYDVATNRDPDQVAGSKEAINHEITEAKNVMLVPALVSLADMFSRASITNLAELDRHSSEIDDEFERILDQEEAIVSAEELAALELGAIKNMFRDENLSSDKKLETLEILERVADTKLRREVIKTATKTAVFAPFSTTFNSSNIAQNSHAAVTLSLLTKKYVCNLKDAINNGTDTTVDLDEVYKKSVGQTLPYINGPFGIVNINNTHAANSLGAGFIGDPPLIFFRLGSTNEEWAKVSLEGLASANISALAMYDLWLTKADGGNLPKTVKEHVRDYAGASASLVNSVARGVRAGINSLIGKTPENNGIYADGEFQMDSNNPLIQGFAKAAEYMRQESAYTLDLDVRDWVKHAPGKLGDALFLSEAKDTFNSIRSLFEGKEEVDFLTSIEEAVQKHTSKEGVDFPSVIAELINYVDMDNTQTPIDITLLTSLLTGNLTNGVKNEAIFERILSELPEEESQALRTEVDNFRERLTGNENRDELLSIISEYMPENVSEYQDSARAELVRFVDEYFENPTIQLNNLIKDMDPQLQQEFIDDIKDAAAELEDSQGMLEIIEQAIERADYISAGTKARLAEFISSSTQDEHARESFEAKLHHGFLTHSALDVRNALFTQLWAVRSLQVVAKDLLKIDGEIDAAKANKLTKMILPVISVGSGFADNVAAYLFGKGLLDDIYSKYLGPERYEQETGLRNRLNRSALLAAVFGGALTKIGNGPNMLLSKVASIDWDERHNTPQIKFRKIPLGESLANPPAIANVIVNIFLELAKINKVVDSLAS